MFCDSCLYRLRHYQITSGPHCNECRKRFNALSSYEQTVLKEYWSKFEVDLDYYIDHKNDIFDIPNNANVCQKCNDVLPHEYIYKKDFCDRCQSLFNMLGFESQAALIRYYCFDRKLKPEHKVRLLENKLKLYVPEKKLNIFQKIFRHII